MKHTLLAGIAAIALMAGTGFASAQSQQAPVASPQAQPNTQTRDQEGTPGTGMSSPAPASQPRAGATTAAPPAAAPSTMGQGSPQFQGGTTSPATSADTRDRDQEGTPGTGRSAPAAGGSPRQ